MKTITNIGVSILKLILSLITLILLLIIIFNIGVILATRVFKADYPSLLDYTYYIVEKDYNDLNIQEEDLLLIDMRVIVGKDDIVMYKNETGYNINKVKNVDKNIVLENDEEIPKSQIIGKSIKQMSKMGSKLEIILQPGTLIISIVILTLTSILQSYINKNTKKENTKPDFNQTW